MTHDEMIDRALADLKECIRLSNLIIEGTPSDTVNQIYRDINYSPVVHQDGTTSNSDVADSQSTACDH